MQTITGGQIRAARGLANWDREKLSQESGVSVSQIAAIELGTTESPRNRTLTEIERAFLRTGIIFKDGGVIPKTDGITRVEGEGWYLTLLDDVYQTLLDQKNAEVVFFCSDDKKSPPEVNNRLRKIRNAGIKMRQLVQEGNTYLMGALNEYRYVPKERYKNYVSLIYADKVAICLQGGTYAIIFKDAELASTWRNMFELIWEHLPQPEKSNAKERF